MANRLTKAERAAFNRIKGEINGVGAPEDLERFLSTYAGAGAHMTMDPPHYTTVCVGPTGRAVQTRDGAHVEVDDQIQRRDLPGVYWDDDTLFVIPSQHAERDFFLEERTGREFVVVANGMQDGKDPRPYFFAAVARELLR